MDQALSPTRALPWTQGFAQLGAAFYADVPPQPLPEPYWVARNTALGQQLGLPPLWLDQPQALQALAGNVLLPGCRMLAGAYAGHQFGVWAGRLGDGRAVLLGELADATGELQEVQLKGAGLTPFSRMGDGRAVLRSSIREYLGSEAMHALGVPTTRALTLTGSAAPVYREQVESSAVVTRVAPSFVRFGHFEYYSHLHAHTESPKHQALRQLADWVLARHYPECASATQPYAALLQATSDATAELLAHWQAVGFCHGVMNTDNMSMAGLTLDYGPFQFLDGFDPAHVCNHSDSQGRYAFMRQPQVAHWNLACLAQALLPLIGEQDVALATLESFKTRFQQAFLQRMRAKLGLALAHSDDAALVDELLSLLASERVDYPIFWRRLSHWVARGAGAAATPTSDVAALFVAQPGIAAWLVRYAQRLGLEDAAAGPRMLATNPAYVLRNYLAEQAIRQAQHGDFGEVARLHELLAAPFTERAGMEAYANFPPSWAAGLEISCSS